MDHYNNKNDILLISSKTHALQGPFKVLVDFSVKETQEKFTKFREQYLKVSNLEIPNDQGLSPDLHYIKWLQKEDYIVLMSHTRLQV